MTTTNYSWTLPTVGASVNTWGTLVNNILTDIDAKMFARTGGTISGNVSVAGDSSATGTIFSSVRGTSAGFMLPDWRMYNTSSGNALAFNNGSDRMTLDGSGNFGLGVTPSAWSVLRPIQIGNAAISGFGTQVSLHSNNYYNGTNFIYSTSAAAALYQSNAGAHFWSTAPSGTAGNAIPFTQAMTLDASGNLLVGTTTSSGRLSIKASGTATYAAAFYDSTNTFLSGFYVGASGINGGYNGANCVQWVARDATTSRSINAGGTINASGADYAEYERNNGIKFAKGQIVGFKQDGTLTDIYADAIRFGVKSTNPAYVGGDAWGSEKQVGKRPDEPQFNPPEYKGPQDPGPAPTGPVQQTLADDASDEYKVKASDDFASAHAAWVAASADHEKLAYEYHAAQVDHAARVEVAKQLFDTDTYPEYQRALAEFEARLEAERRTVDRIAYCGKVPVAVYDATPGGYIIADKDSKGKIVGKFVADPDFAQYKKAVGRVNRIMDAEASAHLVEAINGADPTQFIGMAEIAVIVH